jgi:hypothetical protein
VWRVDHDNRGAIACSWTPTCEERALTVSSVGSSKFGIYVTEVLHRTAYVAACSPVHLAITLVPSFDAPGHNTGRACCGLASVHHLPRPTARAMAADHGRRASSRSSCKLAGVEWDDSVAGSSSVWISTECVRAPDPLRCHHLQGTRQLRLSILGMMLLYHPVRDLCDPARRKG